MHKFALTDRCRRLLRRHIHVAAVHVQFTDSHADGAGRNKDDLMSCVLQIRQDLDKFFNVSDVQSAARMGQR